MRKKLTNFLSQFGDAIHEKYTFFCSRVVFNLTMECTPHGTMTSCFVHYFASTSETQLGGPLYSANESTNEHF